MPLNPISVSVSKGNRKLVALFDVPMISADNNLRPHYGFNQLGFDTYQNLFKRLTLSRIELDLVKTPSLPPVFAP